MLPPYPVERLLRVANELGPEPQIAEQRLGEVGLEARAQLASRPRLGRPAAVACCGDSLLQA